jgi:eukaryotic-like serine/threonine-protein kinase
MGGRDPRRSDEFETVADGAAAVKAVSDSAIPPPSSGLATPPPSSDAMMTVELGPDSPTLADAPRTRQSSFASGFDQSVFPPGTVLGQRYEILGTLGRGGMGAVYKARDREVNRIIALKVIRPDLAGNSSIIDRFKQELVLSHQVTHRNVVRIYDLGEADGVKFITMEYIEGSDLRSLIKERKAFPPGEAVETMIQICRALEAAHGVGVIHRDLKPQNVMRDNQGRVVVMDFGLARLVESDGMTQTGALVGTMEYMSPEQALGSTLDQRSDLFTVGLIFYELLTGKMPFRADSALASLIKRTQERAAPVTTHDSSIPTVLANIVSKCMERDPKLRYQNAEELLQDLEAWQGKRAAATLHFPASARPWGQTIPWHWVGGVIAVLVLAAAGYLLREKLSSANSPKGPTPSAGPVISLAVLPFKNASSDPSINWLGGTLAEMLRTDIGESASLRTVGSDRVNQVLHDLRINPETTIDPSTLRQVADFTTSDRIIWGQYIKLGDQIRIDATLQDLKQQRNFPLKADAANEKELPKALQQLAESVEKVLSLPAETIKELQAKSLKPSSQSVPALRYYNEGVQFSRLAKFADAQNSFQAATHEDGNFALAFAKLGQAYANQGYANEAEQATRKAVDLSEGLPPQEKYLISAIHFQATNDTQKAIDAYETVTKVLPEDSDVQFALADLYNTIGSFDKARAHYDQLLARDPKYIEALYGRASVEISSGNSQNALDYLNRALSLSIELGNVQEQSRLLYGLGVAYGTLNKPEEALRNYQSALGIQRQQNAKRDIALTLNGMGQIQDALGKSADALKSFQEALQIRRDLGNKRDIGDTLIDFANFYEARGHNEEALSMLKESLQIQRDVGNQAYEALCLSNIGANYTDEGKYDDALTYLTQGAELREKLRDPGDIADSNYEIAEVLTRVGQYDQAIAHYMKALELWRGLNDKRHGAYASYGLGNVFEQQGRLGAALDARTEALKTVREVQDQVETAEMLGGYAESLALLGRNQEAEKNATDALELARNVKNDSFIAQNFNVQGDTFFYRGDMKAAAARYQQALKIPSRTNNRGLSLVAKINLAKVAVKQGRSRESISVLRTLAEQADTAGLKYLSVECSVYLGEALLNTKDYAKAQEELNRALARSDKLGLQMLQAKAHYFLATALRLTGNSSEASQQFADAHRILDNINKEAKSSKLLTRNDLADIYSESPK